MFLHGEDNHRIEWGDTIRNPKLLDGEDALKHFDVVVANILSNPLKILAPMLSARVKPGGYLILAGIFEWQTLEMQDAYKDYVALQPWRDREGWICLVAQKATD